MSFWLLGGRLLRNRLILTAKYVPKTREEPVLDDYGLALKVDAYINYVKNSLWLYRISRLLKFATPILNHSIIIFNNNLVDNGSIH